MPVTSKAQWRLMQAAAHGKSDKVSPAVAKEFLSATHSPKHLPERKGAHHRLADAVERQRKHH
jgi:hypothetical protein